MSGNQEKNKDEPKGEVPTIESEEETPEKKTLTPEEDKEIFGEEEKEDKELVEQRKLYEGKTDFERIVHQDTGMWPDEWLNSQVATLMKSDHGLIGNWNRLNDWIRDITLKLDIAKVIADKVHEFCPEKCANPYLVKTDQFLVLEQDNETIGFIATVCLECPLYTYGLADGVSFAPDEAISGYKVGDKIVKEKKTDKTLDKRD